MFRRGVAVSTRRRLQLDSFHSLRRRTDLRSSALETQFDREGLFKPLALHLIWQISVVTRRFWLKNGGYNTSLWTRCHRASETMTVEALQEKTFISAAKNHEKNSRYPKKFGSGRCRSAFA